MTQPPPSASFRAPAPVFTLDNAQRQVLTRKLATLLLRPLAANPYRTIVLSGCSFGDAAVNVAGPLLLTLARKQCLHTVILSDILASLSADEALRSLSSLAASIGIYKQLVAVDLSHNAIGTRGMAACAPLLQSQPQLQVVNLEDTGLSTDAARLLREYMLSSATSSPSSVSSIPSSPASSTTSASLTNTTKTTSLQGLNVHGNRLESEGLLHIAAVVERSPQLHCLRASSVGASSAAVTTLARALLCATDLRELDISDNLCDEETATALAAALAQQPRLARLVLSDLNMGDTALSIIVDALLASRAPVMELRLSGNELTVEAARDIARLLSADHSRLSILDLSSNSLTDEGITIIADAISNSKSQTPLAKLYVADNEVTSLAAVHLASRLVQSPGVLKLDFSQNEEVSFSVSKRIAAIFAPTVVVLDEDEDYNEGDNNSVGNDADADADTDAEVDPVDDDDKDPHDSRQSESTAQQVESALQALERAVRSERGETEPASPGSQPEVSRLVQFFSTPDEKTKNENIANGTDSTNEPTSSTAVGATNDSGHVPATPPPSRFLSGITSPITPPPSTTMLRTQNQGTSNSRSQETQQDQIVDNADIDMEEAEMDADADGDGDVEGDGNVILSARKLKESIVSLSKEISDVAGELEMPVSSPLQPRTANDGSVGPDEFNDINSPLAIGGEGSNNSAGGASVSAGTRRTPTSNPSSALAAAKAARLLSTQSRSTTSFVTIAVDCAGGCLVALFVIMIVLAIAQSQEESTFSFRPL